MNVARSCHPIFGRRSLKSDHTLLLTDADMHTQQREHTA